MTTCQLFIVCETVSPSTDDDKMSSEMKRIHQRPKVPDSVFAHNNDVVKAFRRAARAMDNSEMQDDEEQDDCFEKVCEKDSQGKTLFCNSQMKSHCHKAKTSSSNISHLPGTRCRQIEREVCGPESCPVVQKPKECRTEPKLVRESFKRHYKNSIYHAYQVRVSIPYERCSQSPERVCEERLKPVSQLVTEERCQEFPKEICHTLRVPNRTLRPAVKEHCYQEGRKMHFLKSKSFFSWQSIKNCQKVDVANEQMSADVRYFRYFRYACCT